MFKVYFRNITNSYNDPQTRNISTNDNTIFVIGLSLSVTGCKRTREVRVGAIMTTGLKQYFLIFFPLTHIN